MNESNDTQEDTGQDSGEDNLSQPRDSESSPHRRRRIRDGGLGGKGQALPDKPRRWRDRFTH